MTAPDEVFRRVEYDKMTKRARVLFCRESKPGADEVRYIPDTALDAIKAEVRREALQEAALACVDHRYGPPDEFLNKCKLRERHRQDISQAILALMDTQTEGEG